MTAPDKIESLIWISGGFIILAFAAFGVWIGNPHWWVGAIYAVACGVRAE